MKNEYPSRKRFRKRQGFTLLEMMTCTVILLIVALAISPALLGAQRNWQNAQDSIMSDLVQDGRLTRIAFQRAARRACRSCETISSKARSIDLPYYDGPDSTYVDRYAMLSYSNGCLNLSEGLVDPSGARTTLSSTIVCSNVSEGVFSRHGNSIRMELTLTEGTRQVTMVTAAVMNN